MPIINMVYKKKQGWKPWANTIAYYPLKTDFNEWSWKSWLDITEKWWVSIQNWYALFSSWYCIFWDWATIEWSKTISMWIYRTSSRVYLLNWQYANQYIIIDNSWYCYIPAWQIPNTFITANSWVHLVFLEWDTNMEVYINWQLAWSLWKWWLQYKWTQISDYSNQKFSWRISELIFEDKIRTADEILAYYNQTKSLYGIS